ncbi:hypothetical protein VTP01DRAFT_6244 [Rhizomucor pusillus]|uniref:uncharacterized protein n=1 Tax=Rhizomucor pusillus TaxID=4840 RepID=UPI0037442343
MRNNLGSLFLFFTVFKLTIQQVERCIVRDNFQKGRDSTESSSAPAARVATEIFKRGREEDEAGKKTIKKVKKLMPNDISRTWRFRRKCASYSWHLGTNKIGFVSCRHLPKKIPAKYRKAGARIRSSFGNMIKRDERSFLLKLAGVKSLAEIELLIKSIPSVSLLLRYRSYTSHDAGWYQTHLMQMFSTLYLYRMIATEQREQSAIQRHQTPEIKKIKKIEEKEKEVKVDLLLFTKVYGDIFAYEYKPTDASENDIQSDVRKRQQRLI